MAAEKDAMRCEWFERIQNGSTLGTVARPSELHLPYNPSKWTTHRSASDETMQ